MSKHEIIRAWKDKEYRESLSEEEREQLPDNPAGTVEMSSEEMRSARGGHHTIDCSCCDETTCIRLPDC